MLNLRSDIRGHSPLKKETLTSCLVGSQLSEDNGDVDENVTPKYNLALSQVFRDYSVLFVLWNTGDLSCNWMGTNGFKLERQKMNGSFLCGYVVVNP